MFSEVNDISIKAIACSFPENIEINQDQQFIEHTGIKERRIAVNESATSLCISAAQKVLDKMGWKDIDILVFVTQTPDVQIPSMSCLIQEKLKLSTCTACFDINLSCSGWVYGLAVISSMMGVFAQKGLLLVGDTLSKVCDKSDNTTYPLFGDAGSATALMYNPGKRICFNLGTDGRGHEVIIKRDDYLRMDGTAVFFFTQQRIIETLKLILLRYNITNVGSYIFHQSNKFIIDMIGRKLKIPAGKILYSLEKYGNTSSASIPVTLWHNKAQGDILACGYGAGLSWGTAYFNLDIDYE